MQSCDRTKHGFALAGKGQNELETNDDQQQPSNICGMQFNQNSNDKIH